MRKRRFPVVGSGSGLFSFIHVDDAADATVAAVERGAPGVYNVVDDEPAALRDWVPAYAEAIGAPPPRRVPVWLARLVAGKMASSMNVQPGASNAKAKRELGWQPRWSSWREGFSAALAVLADRHEKARRPRTQRDPDPHDHLQLRQDGRAPRAPCPCRAGRTRRSAACQVVQGRESILVGG